MTLRRSGWTLRDFALLVALALLPFGAITGSMTAVNLHGNPTGELLRWDIPREAWVAGRCSWFCHNHECTHSPVLGAPFTGTEGIYGETISLLLQANRYHKDGYGIACVLVFCVLWPGVMFGLYVAAITQCIVLRGRVK